MSMDGLHPERRSARLYRSGDLGRLNADGPFDYVECKDTILKLDGRRIEAGEVEHQAGQGLSLNDAIVVDLLGAIDAKEDPILAYLYLDDHPASTPSSKAELDFRNAKKKDPYAVTKVSEVEQRIAEVLPKYNDPQGLSPCKLDAANRVEQDGQKQTACCWKQ